MSDITWKLVEVDISKLKPNEKNPKIRDDAGFKLLKKSLESFGDVFDGICNADYSIIDGHSRIEIKEEEVEGTARVFVPSRMLTKEEMETMNAVFDLSRAGLPDYSMMSEQVINEWVTSEEITGSDGKSKVTKADNALYPIVPKFNEKYDAFIIVSDNETDTAFLKTKFKTEKMKSYKSSEIGETFVLTAKQIAECLK